MPGSDGGRAATVGQRLLASRRPSKKGDGEIFNCLIGEEIGPPHGGVPMETPMTDHFNQQYTRSVSTQVSRAAL